MSEKELVNPMSETSGGAAGGDTGSGSGTGIESQSQPQPLSGAPQPLSGPHPLNDRWWLWNHGMQDKDYSKESYKRIGDPLTTVEQFLGLWRICEGEGKLEDRLREKVSDSMFFLMRHGPDEEPIVPMWEDKHCSHGGAWKFRVPIEHAAEAFYEIAIRLIGETISDSPHEILGVSISPKKKAVTLRIWNSDDSKRDHTQLNLPDFEYFKEVLYDAHRDYQS